MLNRRVQGTIGYFNAVPYTGTIIEVVEGKQGYLKVRFDAPILLHGRLQLDHCLYYHDREAWDLSPIYKENTK